ncbi:MAG: arginyltransferase [Kordiimonadaceae bacterium]|nr:arginyltransferase [Kordiimonadaceae bacterium]
MTDQGLQFPKFYVTAPSPCPYIEGLVERKVFTELRGPDAAALSEALGRVGFRRSQSVVYRPACESCSQCVSVRVRAGEFKISRSQKKVLRNNKDLIATVLPAEISDEQFELLQSYLAKRHSEGTMADMTKNEYRDMVESSPVSTVVVEYRRVIDKKLMAVALSDQLTDGLSMIYSFFDVDDKRRSLGTYIILDHISRAANGNQPFVYLGYWVKESSKMSYKYRFKPLEQLGPNGWFDAENSEETSQENHF